MNAKLEAYKAAIRGKPAVRMLTPQECATLLGIYPLLLEQKEAIVAFCAVNAGNRIPADGKIGGV